MEEPDHATRSGLRLENVATYDMFVYQHSFSKRDGDAKDNDTDVCLKSSDVDFGHEGPTFLTWHRYYVLIVERELGRIAERLGSPNGWNRYTFALPYWDWSDSDKVKNDIFSRSYLGTFDFDPQSARTLVEGVLFDDNNWPMVCDKHYVVNVDRNMTITCPDLRRVCNPNTDRSKAQPGRLERGKFTLRGQNPPPDIRKLPVSSTIKHLLSTNTYDAEVRNMANHYGIESAGSSFRNRLEGFVNITNVQTGEFAESGSGPTHNNFHNAIHIFIHGHMRIVPSASNDPIFYLHHANVDRLFEAWLQGCGRGTSFVPQNRVAHPGHNRQDYLVPFFPLKTNNDMYKKSNEFGYTYQELDQAAECPADGPTGSPTGGPGGKCNYYSDNSFIYRFIVP